MESCEPSVEQPVKPATDWSPVCCGLSMHRLLRRVLVRSNGELIFSSVWHCAHCGRLVQ